MLRKIRIAFAWIFWISLTLLFVDFTGTAHAWLGWMAKLQFMPALFAANFLVLSILVILTLILGRVYCSVICPLGVMQDGIAWFGRRFKRNRYSYSPAKRWLRGIMLGVYALSVFLGLGSLTALLSPYSSYGRIAQSLLSPLWGAVNNLLAGIAEHYDSYMFYETDVWVRSLSTLCIALLTLVLIGVLAYRNGRTYCNTICPVGTILGLAAKYSLFKIHIDTSRCNGCGLCARNCKAAAICSKEHEIDYSRCVACFDCLGKCRQGAISFTLPFGVKSAPKSALKQEKKDGISRRTFLMLMGAFAASSASRAQEKVVDGGLAQIVDKKAPQRRVPIVPPGAQSLSHLSKHCTGCQLCVAACPNGVLRPQQSLLSLMQPESSYERGYCRPECTRCSQVCPAGAILPLTPAQKSSVKIGHAVWTAKNCIPVAEGDKCGACAKHCPVGAITMVHMHRDDDSSPMIPVVDRERCIGCGACENLCPARPFSAIHVEGEDVHRII